MAQSLDLHLGFSSLIPVAHADLSVDAADDQGYRPGSMTMGTDRMGGFKIFRYGKTQQSGGQSKGELAKRHGHVEGTPTTGTIGTVTADTGQTNDTTHLSDTGNWSVVDEAVGKLVIITVDAGGAGAAPEGEVSIVLKNSVDTLTLDTEYPFTAAPAVSDTYITWSVYHHDDSTDGDYAINVLGVLMGDRSANYFGWLQIYGLNPGTIYTAAGVTKGAAVVAGAAAVAADGGTDPEYLWVGHAPNTIASDLGGSRSSCFIDVFHMAQPADEND